jgi:hypothetical protein
MHLARAHSYKSVTCVFNYLKLILISFLAITSLTACTTLSNRTAAVAPITISELEVEYPTIDLIDAVAVEAPVLEVREISVPMEPLELHEKARIVMSDAEIRCMTDAIYHEARSESYEGRVAVGYVVLNRIADGRFRDSVCGTVYQKDKGRCQFSWCKSQPRIKYPQLYREANEIALRVMRREVENPIGNSLFFHAGYVDKGKKYAMEYRIGGHRFYGAVVRM